MKHVEKLIDENPGFAPFLAGWQIYDVTDILPMIETMCIEQAHSRYPLFASAGLPAPRTILDFGSAFGSMSLQAIPGRIKMDIAGYSLAEQAFSIGALKGYDLGSSPCALTVPVGEIYEASADNLTPKRLAYLCSCALDAIAMPTLIEGEHRPASRPFRRRHREADGVVFRTCRFRRTSGGMQCATAGGESKRMLHFVSGHWRRSGSARARVIEGELRVWVDGFWRGDPELGISVKRYKALGPEAAA